MVKVVVNVGEVYGDLTILEEIEPFIWGIKKYRAFKCQCICGKLVEVDLNSLRSGNTVSCGCNKTKRGTKFLLENNPARITHGLSKHPLYDVHKHILARCCDENNPAFDNYGGRGIDVYHEWANSLASFVDWAESNGYEPGLEIDRIDNNKGYHPDNCRFVDRFVNSNNKRNNIKVNIGGQEMILRDAVPEYSDLSIERVRERIYKGWSDEDALKTPLGKRKGER